ncbi:MAG: hypothetical protein ABIE70_01210 [bacterium]
MQPILKLVLSNALMLVVLFCSAKADAPRLLNYQGYLADSTGVPLDTTTSLTFVIYDDTLKTTELWGETHDDVTVAGGAFTVLLGSVNPLPLTVFDGSVRGMVMQIESGPVSDPPMAIVSVAYAFRAIHADTALYAQSGGSGGSAVWEVTDSVAHTLNLVGISRGNAGNSNHGPHNFTFVNLGLSSQAGDPGFDRHNITIGGGVDNAALSDFATVSGGHSDTVAGTGSTIGGGLGNVITNDYSFIGGGDSNLVSGGNSCITGGVRNTITSFQAFIGGGKDNFIAGHYAIIVGGKNDTITNTGDYSYLVGIDAKLTQDSTFMVDMPHIRFGDESSGYKFPVADGVAGQTMATDGNGQLGWSSVGGTGFWTLSGPVLATNDYWAIGRGGSDNVYYGDSIRTMVNMGVGSQTGLDGQDYYYATVGGGWHTSAKHNFATVAGGDRNSASGEHSTIGGGRANEIKAAAQRATIAGGNGNIAHGSSSFIGGGGANQTFGNDAAVVGGWDNDAYGWRSIIGSGSWNRTDGDMSVVAGGQYNNAVGGVSSVSGGTRDTAAGYASAVGGGEGNHAAGSRSNIAGGYKNRVDGDYSAVLGGYGDTITSTADYSYLFGLQSTLTQDSTFMIDMPHIRFGDEISGYEFPPSDGSAGQALVSDGAGHVGWSNVSGGSGLTLPYNDTVSTAGYTFSITNNGGGDGCYFQSGGFSRQAVHGVATGNLGRGVTGIGNGQHGIGVYGRSNDFSDGDAFGGKFESFGLNGRGAYGTVSGIDASGIYGEATGTRAKGVYGEATGAEGRAMAGWANNSGDVLTFGGHFVSNGLRGRGVFGQASHQGGYVTYGGYFESKSSIGVGVYGLASSTSDTIHYGGLFEAMGVNGVSVMGDAVHGLGVKGYSQYGVGVWAETDEGVALSAKSPAGLAADFEGNVRVRSGYEFQLGNVTLVDDTVITPTVYITGGSDLSEMFEVVNADCDRPLPGMLVCIDDSNPGQLKVSNKAYDPRVAGVISGAGGVQPGMMMGQRGTIADGENSVALVGRAYCWADADYGEIRPGDMLTSSSTPGHAMRAADRERAYGTIVGKAMTALPEGRGLVLVLVGLQ